MTRLLRSCAVLVLAVPLALGAAYVAIGLSGTAEVGAAKERAVADVAAALPQATRSVERQRRAVLRAVEGRWGSPSHSWRELTCALEDHEGGLIVQDYYQECSLRTVDLIPTDRAASHQTAPEFCVGRRIPRLRGATGAERAEAYLGSAAALTNDPYASSCPDGVIDAPAAGVSRMLEGARPSALAPGSTWTVVVVETVVSTSTLGCSPWGLLFCSAPVDSPVMGEADSAPPATGAPALPDPTEPHARPS